MPRPCKVCASESRALVEAELAGGATFAAVSRDSRFKELTVDSLERHWSNHVAPELQDAAFTVGADPLSIAQRMSSLAGEVALIRIDALKSGDTRLALQAIKLEGDLLSRLIDRLGVRPDAVEEAFAEADSLIKLVAHIARHSPRAGEWIADQLPPERAKLAGVIRGVAQRAY